MAATITFFTVGAPGVICFSSKSYTDLSKRFLIFVLCQPYPSHCPRITGATKQA